MLDTAKNPAHATYEPPGALQNRIRLDRGGQTERLALALEMIAASLSQIAAPQKPACQVLTYEEVAIALNVSIDVLGKMVADGRLRQGRHYIRIGANVRFVSNLVALILEDQSPLIDATLAPVAVESKTEESISSAGEKVLNRSHELKFLKQAPVRTASKNRAGLDINRTRRAS